MLRTLLILLIAGIAHAQDTTEETVAAESEPLPTEILVGRIVLITLIGPATLFMSYVPWMLHGKVRSQFMEILAIGSALSAGVILGAAFSHIAPEASEAFVEYFEIANPEYEHVEYPFWALTAIGIFFVLVVLDKLIVDPLLRIQHKHAHNKAESSPVAAAQGKKPSDENAVAVQDTGDKAEDAEGNKKEEVNQVESEHRHALEIESDEHHHHHHGQNHVALALEHFADGSAAEDLRLKRLGTAYIFLTALSVHSVFDGLAVGSETDTDGFLGLLIAVIIHKLLDGFALGVPIFYAKFSKLQTFLALAFCACMTPLGIGIGWVTTESQSGASALLTRAIFLSMSLGSFIYIALIELLPAGLASPKFMVQKIVVAVFGWGLMALLALWV
jgi:zinc transporter ZupT